MTKKTSNSNIFLLGFMASGKSSLGKKIAKRLDREFIDLDKAIERLEHCTINEIFEHKGENYFRETESEVLANILKENQKNCVIALGGGTFCSEKNISLVQKNGFTIYLYLELKNIIGRLKADKENRPLVKDLKEEDLHKKVTALFNSRESFYEQAEIKLEAQKSKSKLIKEIEDFIENQK